MHRIRPLHPQTDRPLVEAFFQSSADYIQLERGEAPSPLVTEEYFTDAPPGCDPAKSLRLGLFNTALFDPAPNSTALIALAEMGFGYPTATDAYLGLMMVAPAARGTGAGRFLLRHLEQAARQNHMQNLYLGVLDANPRGRAFWQREGFTLALANRPITLGQKTQLAHRLVKPLTPERP